MGESTAISWTDHTFNPWWGCTRVSEGCRNCYAEIFAKRTGTTAWGPGVPRRFFGEQHWNEPLRWDRLARAAGVRRRVFCASMADIFDPEVPAFERHKVWKLIEATPNLDWLLLTKRPHAALDMVPENRATIASRVQLGTTVENQDAANDRIPSLVLLGRRWGVERLFLSCEPLIGPVDLHQTLAFWGTGAIPGQCVDIDGDSWHRPESPPCPHCGHRMRVGWVIIGGESGPGARPCALEWIEALVKQCRQAGAAPFVKQLGAYSVSEQRTAPAEAMSHPELLTPWDRAPNGEVWAWRAGLRDRKGGDIEEFPADLRIREFPEVRRG